jgi:hypothetical protein
MAHGLSSWLSCSEAVFASLSENFGGGEQSALPNAGIPSCARFHPGNPVIWNQ